MLRRSIFILYFVLYGVAPNSSWTREVGRFSRHMVKASFGRLTQVLALCLKARCECPDLPGEGN